MMLALRHGTHDLHEQLETTPVFSCLMSDSVSRSEYVNALQILHHFYSEIEPILRLGVEKYLPNHSYIPRLNLLERDLSGLGIACGRTQRPLSLQLGKSQTLGILYVVEGSTLGGQIISRHLQDKLGVHVKDALSFYTLDGNLSANHWAQLKMCFRESLVSPTELGESIESARDLFLKLLKMTQSASPFDCSAQATWGG